MECLTWVAVILRVVGKVRGGSEVPMVMCARGHYHTGENLLPGDCPGLRGADGCEIFDPMASQRVWVDGSLLLLAVLVAAVAFAAGAPGTQLALLIFAGVIAVIAMTWGYSIATQIVVHRRTYHSR
jgi:hypothetical protein